MRILRKVLADLWSARGRAALVVLAMATGLFAVVCIAVTNAVLTRELGRSFEAITPASVTIRTERPFATGLQDSIARLEGVGAVAVGRSLSGRVMVGDERRPILVMAAPDLAAIGVNRLRSQSGAWPAADGQVLLERSAVRVAKAAIGDSLVVRVGRRAPVALTVAGTLHDFSQAPAWQEGMIYGYVNARTMAQLAGEDGFTEVRFRVADRALDVPHIREVAQRVAATLVRAGYGVRSVQIPPPGEHPHQGQMNSLLGMQQAFGTVALILSGAIIVVLLSAMLAQHRRQIGTMKSLGARQGTIVWMYLAWLLILAGGAEIVALPAGIAAGRVYARFIADMLNFDVVDATVPAPVLLALVAFGVVLPLAVALAPILRAAASTTRAALFDALIARTGAFRGGRRAGGALGRMAALGVANAVRARGRFVLVVSTLAVGGALFLSALDLGRSMNETLSANLERLGFDIALDVSDSTPRAAIALALGTVPGVARADMTTRARVMIADRRDPDPRAFALRGAGLEAPAATSPLAGRWLRTRDARTVIATHGWMAEHPAYQVGDSIGLRIGPDSSRWLLAGAVREVVGGAVLYAPAAVVDSATNGRARVTQVRIVGERHDAPAMRALMAAIDRRFADSGITIAQMQSLALVREAREEHQVVIISFLVAMALLSLAVGGLGLATMLSVGIFERSREIGVMRAVGAARRQLLALLVIEGAFIAAAGWVGSLLLSFPATYALDVVFGSMMLGTPLDMRLSMGAIPALAAVVGAIALLASGIPAWRATTLEPRELLIAT